MTARIPLIATACLWAGSAAFAQLPPPPPGGPAPHPLIAAAPDAGTTIVTGRVQQWLLNPNGEADGLLLSNGTQVAFAPHLSAAVMQMLQPGDTVQVSGWRAPNVPVVRALALVANGRSVTDQPPPPPGMAPPPLREPGALTAMTAGGRVERLLYTDRGDIHGVVLDDRTIVRFPPHIAAVYDAQLRPGAPLHARGWGTRSAQGTVLEATSLGRSAGTVREVSGGPGLEPAPPVGGPRGPRGRGPMPPVPVMPPPAPYPAS